MKVHYINAKSKENGEFVIPMVDVRHGAEERAYVKAMVKASNGNTSKFVPAKYGYGPFGPKKY